MEQSNLPFIICRLPWSFILHCGTCFIVLSDQNTDTYNTVVRGEVAKTNLQSADAAVEIIHGLIQVHIVVGYGQYLQNAVLALNAFDNLSDDPSQTTYYEYFQLFNSNATQTYIDKLNSLIEESGSTSRNYEISFGIYSFIQLLFVVVAFRLAVLERRKHV